MRVAVISVKQLNSYVKSLLECDEHLCSFYLKGEISNFKDHYQSGHLYFSLKDSDAVIRAVMFRSSAAYLKFKPQDGMSVICRGRVSLYERDGSYQFYAEEMIPDGVGDLTVAFNQIKEKLEAKGYFDPEIKKPIPEFPKRIAVITSDTGAAVQDILNITSRRYPLCEIIMCPVRVQGDSAVFELIDAIKRVDKLFLVDTIIIGRGGGSIEDLWAFNSEELAEAIHECKTPVISAVGHETDFTICDFVSDLRAPTPSAAAELAVPDIGELRSYIKNLTDRIALRESEMLKNTRLKIESLFNIRIKNHIESLINQQDMRIDKLLDSLMNNINLRLQKADHSFRKSVAQLDALSPLNVLARGYCIPEKDSAPASLEKLNVGDRIDLIFTNGKAECSVDKIIKE
ncbi:MAG: exodeoxyribonuclease VII large subunit [Ruminococcaceae bacterium]|nr:exodeoxyribonuclease VII large subunit [Oscillospiraceae bacterium]